MIRPVIAALAVFMLAGPAGAYVPSGPPPPEAGWDGPGLFCGEGFTFTVEAGEFIREDLQLQLSQPISNTVKSARGWYSISVPFIVDPAEPNTPPPGGRLVSRDEKGALYEYAGSNLNYLGRAFVYFPVGRDRRPVTVEFSSPGTGGDWRRQPPQAELGPEEQRGVLKRIAFGATCPPRCVSPSTNAGQCQP